MSFPPHNVSPTRWWQCSHPGVTLIDSFGVMSAAAALWFTDAIFAQIFIGVVMLQLAASAAYHWRNQSKLLRFFDHSTIYILIAATVLPYAHYHVADDQLIWLYFLGSVTVFAIAIKPLHVHLDWLNSALYVAITLISIYIMLGLARHVGTFATGVFWLGVGLYFLQLVLYHWRYDEF